MRTLRRSKSDLTQEIVGRLARRHSTAVVLFHHAVAERLGLGPTDHKCLDLLRDRGAMAGADLAAITGLTSGAITGVVARLERAGYLRREQDPQDGRRQILHLALKRSPIHEVLAHYAKTWPSCLRVSMSASCLPFPSFWLARRTLSTVTQPGCVRKVSRA